MNHEKRAMNLTAQPLALPLGLVALLALAACGDSEAATTSSGPSSGASSDCPPTTSSGGDGGSSGEGGGTSTTSTTGSGGGGTDGPDSGAQGTGNNAFDHMNDPGDSGKKDPFEILKERAEEGPPEIRTRLHGCTKLRYAALGDLLTSRGVNLNATAPNGQPKTAGQLYAEGRDALGVARFDAREAETPFHTTSGASKLFDIFVQAAPEVIANIQNVAACQVNGVGAPMFDQDGTCNEQALSCIMARPAKPEDVLLCDLMVGQSDGTAGDTARKRNIAVAVFLSAAHTCE